MKLLTRIVMLTALLHPTLSYGQTGHTSPWDLFPEAKAETVRLQVPPALTTTEPVELAVLIGLPSGCYKAEVTVRHQDEFTHVIRPVLYPSTSPCVPISRYDHQIVRMRSLPPGEHRILVENVARPEPEATIWITDDQDSAGGT